MKVRAKLRVDDVAVNPQSDIVKFSAVYGGDKNSEDNTFAAATPSASLTMQIDNPAVRGHFKSGQKYYVDFTQAES